MVSHKEHKASHKKIGFCNTKLNPADAVVWIEKANEWMHKKKHKKIKLKDKIEREIGIGEFYFKWYTVSLQSKECTKRMAQ